MGEMSKTAAELLQTLKAQRRVLDADKKARNDRRVVIAGRALAIGGLAALVDGIAKLRASLDDDDQSLFNEDLLELDGWKQIGEGRWQGLPACPHAPERPGESGGGATGSGSAGGSATSVASPEVLADDEAAAAAWTAYLVEMSDPVGWQERQRRRAYLLGEHFAVAVRSVEPATLARSAETDEERGLWDARLLELDGWAPRPRPKP